MMAARTQAAASNAAASAARRTTAACMRRNIQDSIGQPLDGALQLRMEARLGDVGATLRAGASLGYQTLEASADAAAADERKAPRGPAMDFSTVRLHADGPAASAARLLGARAFTIGEHVYADPAAIPVGAAEQDELIAHELAHVAQQRQLRQARIQPRLLVRGDAAHIQRFIALAERGMGEDLRYDPLTGEVTAVASLPSPTASPAFAAALHRIIDDPGRNAIAQFGVGQPRVVVGAFPDPGDMTGPNTAQRIDVDDIEALEASVPGNGLALLAHELIENFEAQAQPVVPNVNRYDVSHRPAISPESDVAEETVGPGRRVATVVLAAPPTWTYCFDYENYYLVFQATGTAPTSDFQLSGIRRAPRINVFTGTVDRFVTGSPQLPAAGNAVVNQAAAAVAANPLATVRIEGFTDDVGSEPTNLTLSGGRARAALDALAAAGVNRDHMHAVGRGESRPVAANNSEANRARNRRIVIIVDRPGP